MSLYRNPDLIPPELQKFPWVFSEILCDSDTHQPQYYSLIFQEIYIRSDGSVHEVVSPYNQHRPQYLFLIHLPYASLTHQDSSAPFHTHIPWQTVPICRFPLHIRSIHLYSPQLNFSPEINVLPCNINPDDPQQLYAIDDLLSAPYLLIRSTWTAPKSAKSSYYHERRHKHCSSKYTANLKQSFHAVSFHHVVHKSVPNGVDYWLLPTKSPA